jgi:hypothetical protein
MRAFFSVCCLAVVAACGSSSGTVPPKADAGHDATPPRKRDAGTPILDSGSTSNDAAGCSGAGATWAKMDHQPIVLADPKNKDHRTVAGVDIDGASGMGTTLPEVEAILCPGTPAGHGPSGTRVEAWGVSNEVQAYYDPASLLVEEVNLYPGYYGTMTLPTDPAGPDAGHTFTVGLGQVQKDGAPFVIDWTDVMFTAGTELYNALQYNAAGYTGYDPTSCRTTAACPDNSSSGQRQWQLVTINVTLVFGLGGTAANQSTVVEIDLAP